MFGADVKAMKFRISEIAREQRDNYPFAGFVIPEAIYSVL